MGLDQKISQYKAPDYSFFYMLKKTVCCLRNGGAIFPHKKIFLQRQLKEVMFENCILSLHFKMKFSK